MIAKDVGLNCQPHPAFPKRPPLPINLFLSSLIKKKKKEAGSAGHVSDTVPDAGVALTKVPTVWAQEFITRIIK